MGVAEVGTGPFSFPFKMNGSKMEWHGESIMPFVLEFLLSKFVGNKIYVSVRPSPNANIIYILVRRMKGL
mgnify:CR=1 FL=1